MNSCQHMLEGLQSLDSATSLLLRQTAYVSSTIACLAADVQTMADKHTSQVERNVLSILKVACEHSEYVEVKKARQASPKTT